MYIHYCNYFLLAKSNYVDILNLIIYSFLGKEEFYYKEKKKRPYNKIVMYNQKDVS